MTERRGIGIFGGTFDPIHLGHIHLANSVYQKLNLAAVHFIPAAHPLLRTPPQASEAQRVRMVQLAVATQPFFSVDDREIRRGGNSYMIDTLVDIRAAFPEAPLCLIIGVDQFSKFDQWKGWLDMPSLSHIVVTTRQGFECVLNSQIKDFLFKHKTDKVRDLQQLTCGKIFLLSLDTLPISSTEIRGKIAKGEDVGPYLPKEVGDFITQCGLYK
ncbi:MAG: nadD [Gammaproteobacteria bacterium]|jgi:nicotinate-nucleotide adenylyltransferase|nr:nadD [Gammaproteobacteria bacterium]